MVADEGEKAWAKEKLGYDEEARSRARSRRGSEVLSDLPDHLESEERDTADARADEVGILGETCLGA